MLISSHPGWSQANKHVNTSTFVFPTLQKSPPLLLTKFLFLNGFYLWAPVRHDRCVTSPLPLLLNFSTARRHKVVDRILGISLFLTHYGSVWQTDCASSQISTPRSLAPWTGGNTNKNFPRMWIMILS